MFKKRENRIRTFIERVISASAMIAGIMVLMTLVLVVVEIFRRYLFGSSSSWAADLISEFVLVYITFLPAAWILLQEGHVRVEIVTSLLRPKQRKLMNMFTLMAAFIYSVVLTWQGWLMAWTSLEMGHVFSTAAPLPKFPAYVVIPIGGFFLSLGYILKIVETLFPYRTNKSN